MGNTTSLPVAGRGAWYFSPGAVMSRYVMPTQRGSRSRESSEAMAFSVFGAAKGNIVIDGAECVAKTYPGFWDIFKRLGGELEINA